MDPDRPGPQNISAPDDYTQWASGKPALHRGGVGAALTNSICQFPTLANFKQLTCHHRTWSRQMCTISIHKLVRASSSPPLTTFSPDSATNLGSTSKGEKRDRQTGLAPNPSSATCQQSSLGQVISPECQFPQLQKGSENVTSRADYLESVKSHL